MKEEVNTSLKQRIHEIIYEADTPAGKFFDVAHLSYTLLIQNQY